jgi:hypothetical protein
MAQESQSLAHVIFLRPKTWAGYVTLTMRRGSFRVRLEAALFQHSILADGRAGARIRATKNINESPGSLHLGSDVSRLPKRSALRMKTAFDIF